MLFTLTSALRQPDISSRELVEHAIAAVEEHDGAINAVVATRFEQALVTPGYRSLVPDLDAEVNGQPHREVVQCS